MRACAGSRSPTRTTTTLTTRARARAARRPSMRGLPAPPGIAGPLAARRMANGSEIDASVNLDTARVRWLSLPDEDDDDADDASASASAAPTASFDKPAGKPLNLTVH